jgi:hypothetical protein
LYDYPVGRDAALLEVMRNGLGLTALRGTIILAAYIDNGCRVFAQQLDGIIQYRP